MSSNNDEGMRPDPDQLLATVTKDEEREGRGHLRIFLGMVAGVGKTFAMLSQAKQKATSGVDVVIGLIDTHGRKETAALIEGFEFIPRKKMTYRETIIEEMDLDAILERRPKLVVVDELAHTNAPGSRHSKRYLDVMELLDEGIDVWTALNVQHLESRSDTVTQITGVPIRELVPDSILDRADEVTLIDLPPEELLRRLKEGKIYATEAANRAAQNFFQVGNLTALREIALRITAERVDQELREIMQFQRISGPWKASERLMVAVFGSPYSEKLIRWTRRMAYTLGAPWMGVYVNTNVPMNQEEQDLLTQNLALVISLGGEVVTTSGEDICSTLLRIANQRNITQIVVGKPKRHFWEDLVRGGSLVGRLIRDSGHIDVYVVAAEGKSPTVNDRRVWDDLQDWVPALSDWGQVVLIVSFVTFVSLLIDPWIGYRAVGILYLFLVITSGFVHSFGAVLLASILSGLAWDYLFIPPRYSLNVTEPEDAMMLVVFVVAALVMGSLALRLRRRNEAILIREERASALYGLSHEISQAGSVDRIITLAIRELSQLFNADVAVILAPDKNGDDTPEVHRSSQYILDSKEIGVAQWVVEHEQPAGRFTETLPMAEGHYVPLQAASGVQGVVGLKPRKNRNFNIDQRSLLAAFSQQIAIALEREGLHEEARRTTNVQAVEKMYRSIFGILNDAAKNETGRIIVRKEEHDLAKIIQSAAGEVTLEGHHIVIDIPPYVPPLLCDETLTRHAFTGLFHSMPHGPLDGSSTRVGIHVYKHVISVVVTEQGEDLDHTKPFDGLGLEVAKKLIEIQGGSVQSRHSQQEGPRVIIQFPLNMVASVPAP